MADNPPIPEPFIVGKTVLKPATAEDLEAAGFRNVARALREGLIREATILPSGDVGVVPLPLVDRVALPE